MATVTANRNHGRVVQALRDELERRKLTAFNSLRRDLYVPGEKGAMRALFEVKSDDGSTSVYTAIGQLLFHGGGCAGQLVAVLPASVDENVVDRLKELKLSVVTYRMKNGDVSFDGLDAVVARLSA